jgi:predicted enzyme related to lactoylglutathione lyase
MSNPVNWFHITAKDDEGLTKFYGEAFDWKMSAGPGGMAFADTGKGGIPGGIAAPMDGSEHSKIEMYVDTHNIDEQLARIEKAGGRPAGFKHDLPEGMGAISGFIDPAGNFVGLWQRPPAPPAAPKKAARKAAKKAAKAAKKGAKKAVKVAKKAARKGARKAAKKGAKTAS